MPLAEKTIIAPGDVNARAPLKKSTVAWMLVGIVALALVGVFAPKLFQGDGTDAKPVSDQPVVTGRPQDIDEEFKQRLVAPVVPPLPAPLPVIPSQPEPRPIITTAPVSTGESEIDAAGRTSKSIAFDDQAKTEAVARGQGVAMPAGLQVPQASPDSEANPMADQLKFMQSMAAAQSGGAQQANKGDTGWLKEFQTTGAKRADPLRSYQVRNPYTLLQGKVIPAVLGRDLNTDLPGGVTACSTMDVYDSLTSNHMLMPKGSCFIGQYSNSIRDGQDRILFAFTRVVMPNGVAFDLPGSGGSDAGGAAGLEGDVNNHFLKMFASSFFVAFLADRFEGNNTGTTTNIGTASGAASAAGQVLVDTSSSILDRYKTISPTITVDKGTRMNIEVTKDMEFPGPYSGIAR
jgi:type IV secretion system protein VirB10